MLLQRTEDAVAGYDAVRNLFNRRLFPTIDGVRNTLRLLDRVDAKFGRMRAESLVDERIVRKLERDGVFKYGRHINDLAQLYGAACSNGQ